MVVISPAGPCIGCKTAQRCPSDHTPRSDPCHWTVLPKHSPRLLLYVVVVGRVSADSGRKGEGTDEAGMEGQRVEISERGFFGELSPQHAHTRSAWPSSPGYLDRVPN